MHHKKPDPSGVNPYSYPEMCYLAANVPLYHLIKTKSPIAPSLLSKKISYPQFIPKHTETGDVRPSFLLLMSHAIGYNFFRPYINLLPEELRTTDQTQQLLDTIEQQKQEIETWKERALRAEHLIEQSLKR